MQKTTQTRNQLYTFLALFLLSFCLNAQKPKEKNELEIVLPTDHISSYQEGNIRFNKSTGKPIAMYGLNVSVNEDTPLNMAIEFLNKTSKELGLDQNDIDNLKLHATRNSLSGTVVRLRQHINNIPVNKAEITVNINNNNEVTFVSNGFIYNAKINNTNPSITSENAKQVAYSYLGIQNPTFEKQELFIYHNKKQTVLAYRINVMSHETTGEWEAFINAQTGEIFKAEDISFYCFHEDKEDDKNKKEKTNQASIYPSVMSTNATGTGNVFNPDPLSSAGVAYGTGGHTDNNDANSSDLTSQTFNVTLLDITFSGGQYSLVGPYAEIVDFEAPMNGLYAQASSTFNYQRNADAFEAVNAYYHIDASMRYINTSLNISLMPYQYATGVRFDPHGNSGADNSYYTSGTGRLSFGEGGVDDAEDSDVVHHELGHGLHDWVTSGGLSQADGLSEGCGDYWAQSYNRSLGNWTSSDAAYQYVFNWDGHNEYWPGRTTGYGAVYPGGLVGQIHTDGQIWATCLMKIYDIIGKTQTDKIFLEGLAMTNGTSDQNDAANAAYQAAINMNYPTSEITTIYTEFTACGYTLPEPPGPPVADFTADLTSFCIDGGPVTVNFTDTTTGVPDSWTWSFPGGTPSSSNLENPTVTYDTAGVYQVVLTVSNSFGSDTETKVGYINALSGANCPSCNTVTSSNVPVAISPSGTPTVTSTITVSGSGVLNDVNVVDLNISHTWVNDLTITLTSPAGTSVTLFDDICGSEDDVDVAFDDAAASSTLPCPPNDGNTYQPESPLAAFNGENGDGVWTLTIADTANGDGGDLNSWALELCHQQTMSVEDLTTNDFTIYPNPNNGSFSIKVNPQYTEDYKVDIYDIRGRKVYTNEFNSSSNVNSIDLGNVHSGMYMMTITSHNKSFTKKIVVE